MSIVSYTDESEKLENSILNFFLKFQISGVLKTCNGYKQKGIQPIQIFRYKFSNIFQPMSMYMQQRTGAYKEDFAKNTFYRFINDARINWTRFSNTIAKKAIDLIKPLTDDTRINAFIIDDSIFERTSVRHTELGAKVFDHCDMRYKKGYRMMTCGWTDGSTFIPTGHTLLSSHQEKNVLGFERKFDSRTLAGKRRVRAKLKGTDAMLGLIKDAQHAGISANYVLFDTWFSSPAQLTAIKELGLDSIAMVKNSSRIYYLYNGQKLSLKKIYGMNKKRRGRSKYLLSVDVLVGSEKQIPAKIVFVRNNRRKKDWIAFIATNTEISEEEIIRIYGKRWQIEVFFKTCKCHLNLIGECHSLSYDALTAHVSIVFARYILLAFEQRKSQDSRTLGEIFFFMYAELADITFAEAMSVMVKAMFETISTVLNVTNEQMDLFVDVFISKLPEYLQRALALSASAA